MKKSGIGLPALKAKYNTRSPLMKALVPKPSEGTCRIMFTNFKSPNFRKLPKITSLNKRQHTAEKHFDKSFLSGTANENRNKSQLFGQDYNSFSLRNQKTSVQASRAYHDMNLGKKGEMFSIVAKKVNKDMKKRRMKPIFQ